MASGCSNQAPTTTYAGAFGYPEVGAMTGLGSAGTAGRQDAAAGVANPPAVIPPTVAIGATPMTGTAGAGTAGAAAMTSTPAESPNPQNSAGLPCDVAAVLAAKCQSCHRSPSIGGAPMPLLSVQDLQRPAVTQPSLKVHELALMRINDAARPMPPGGELDAGSRKTLADWLAQGAPAAPPTALTCSLSTPTTGLRDPNDFAPRAGETCYEFTTHAGQTADDRTPLSVGPGEQNEQFYFKVPWPAGSVATSMRTRLDNIHILHHWLLFTTARDESLHGKHESVFGTQLGDVAELIGSWAVGGQEYQFPDDMGFELPDGGMLNLQWHYANVDSTAASDASAVQICTVPAGTRSKTLGITWLGTEYIGGPFGMPAHATSHFTGTCRNNSAGPVTIWAFFPHMHKLGRRFNALVKRADGSLEIALDKPFDYAHQVHYELDPMVTLQPGDEISSTCTFDNMTDARVAYGPQTTQEMCYLLTYAYPAGQLENRVPSLIGASNTCW
jgi:hypothetical protein